MSQELEKYLRHFQITALKRFFDVSYYDYWEVDNERFRQTSKEDYDQIDSDLTSLKNLVVERFPQIGRYGGTLGEAISDLLSANVEYGNVSEWVLKPEYEELSLVKFLKLLSHDELNLVKGCLPISVLKEVLC